MGGGRPGSAARHRCCAAVTPGISSPICGDRPVPGFHAPSSALEALFCGLPIAHPPHLSPPLSLAHPPKGLPSSDTKSLGTRTPAGHSLSQRHVVPPGSLPTPQPPLPAV